LRSSEPVIYSVWLRKGPDIEKYDLVFGEQGIELRFLGEYWSALRPRTGLQKRVDMLLYSIRKKRSRSTQYERTILIKYCEIAGYELKKPLQNSGTASREDSNAARLILILKDGKRIEIYFSGKIYSIAKALIKKYLINRLEKCPR